MVEVNFSVQDCVKVAERFLGAMGDGWEDLVVEVEE